MTRFSVRPRNNVADLRYVYMISAVTALAGLLFGFDIAVINGAIVFLRDAFHLSDSQTELAASSLIFGCICGAGIAGTLTDRYGRRLPLSISALLFVVSSIGAALSVTFLQFEIARFVGGIAIGVASMLAPLYIAEASPANIRGRLVSFNQMAIVTGILLAYLVNWSFSFSGVASWRWMFAVALVPALFLFIGMFFVPESPRWLMEQQREGEALTILERIEGVDGARLQLAAIRDVVIQEKGSFRDLLAPTLRKPMFFVTALAVFSQITGINTVLFYGSLIWERQLGGHNHSAAIGANVTIGVVNFLATLVALWLIDRSGRRPLLLFSCGCMALCQLGLGVAFLLQPPPAFLVLGCMLLCIASFAVGLGPGSWVLMAEIMPTRVRGRAMSVANVALWISSFILTSTFLTLSHALTITGTFILYSVMCVLAFLLIWFLAPETKGRTLEQIEESWLVKIESTK